MQIEEYKKIRKTGKELALKIFKTHNTNQLNYAAKKLNLWSEKPQTLIFDSETDVDILTDFLIYCKGKKGEIVLDDFYESDVQLSDEEEDFLDGMINNYTSLFVLKETDAEKGIIILEDVLSKNSAEYTLIDINLSQTGNINMMFYTRILPVNNVYITSGVSFYFSNIFKDKIINDIRSFRFKKRRRLNPTDLFLLCYQKSRQYGQSIQTADV